MRGKHCTNAIEMNRGDKSAGKVIIAARQKYGGGARVAAPQKGLSSSVSMALSL